MHRFGQSSVVATTVLLVFAAATAHATVTISSKPTQNMSCSGGICAPTARRAVLNIANLENLLVSGNVTVTTTGSSAQAGSIRVEKLFGWSTGSTLVLDSYTSITINETIGVQGTGGLTLTTGDGGKNGAINFRKSGNVSFGNLANKLVINGTVYKLVGDIRTLADDIARKPRGAYALAANYDALQDGVYANAPIEAPFSGVFTGLGNVITKLTIIDQSETNVGLFAQVRQGGTIRDVRLGGINIRADAPNSDVGGVVGLSTGTVEDASVTGRIRAQISWAGGIAGENMGTITNSHSAGLIRTAETSGGLVGENGTTGTITGSWSSAAVGGRGASYCGGLVGDAVNGTITDSYATGSVSCVLSSVGGFVGGNSATITSSYSTGRVRGGPNNPYVGGFVGASRGGLAACYWDTTTSRKHKGVGSGTTSGVTGLTTKELQSGLP